MRPLLFSLLLAVAGCGVHGTELCPTTGPSPRAYATAVVVPTYNEIYLYGGATAGGNSDELWRYSFGACSGWVQLTPTGTSPGGWSRYAAAYDSMRNRIIYIGGPTNQAWSLDVDKLIWTQLLTAGLPPSVSEQSWAIYDSDADRIIFGGVFSAPLAFSDSEQGNWGDPLDFSAPPGSAAATDPTRDAIFAWDGQVMGTYSLNRNVGASFTPMGAVSSSFVDGIGWDPQQKRLLALSNSAVFAIDNGDALATTATVTPLAPTGMPPAPRVGAAFALTGSLALVFGGETAGGCFLGDWWYLNNETSWESRSVATACP